MGYNEYNGWNILDNITLVIKQEKHPRYGYPQGYVVDPRNKKQLDTAKNWGTDTKYIKADDLKNKYDTVVLEPNIVTIENKGFTIELLDSANSSSQGGKLSFWNCLIKHLETGLECVIGIDSNLLLTFLLQNTLVNGKCNSEVILARKSGSVGVLTKNMVEYREALNDAQIKKAISKKKTSKWQIGKSYVTLTIDEIYLGELYKPFDMTYNYNRRQSYDKLYHLVLDNEPIRRVIFNSDVLEGYERLTLSEIYSKSIEAIDKNIEKIVSKNSYVYLSNLTWGVPMFEYGALKQLDKFPSRQQGDIEIIIDMDLNKFYSDIINKIQNTIIKLHDDGYKMRLTDLDNILLRTTKFGMSDLSENEKKILNMMASSNDCKYMIE
ncbi:MAG: hypothetical protein J6A59_15205 [Lachnospiraceae bacterium]|nr:hypothetical protein [Lachnospiraceae bacterium]